RRLRPRRPLAWRRRLSPPRRPEPLLRFRRRLRFLLRRLRLLPRLLLRRLLPLVLLLLRPGLQQLLPAELLLDHDLPLLRRLSAVAVLRRLSRVVPSALPRVVLVRARTVLRSVIARR